MSRFSRESWQFIVGQLGERVAAREFKRAGLSVIASCEFSGENGNHAPVLEFSNSRDNLALPDLDVAGRGKRCWFEIKTYDAAREFRKHGCFVHGIPVRLFDHYVAIERETGSEVYLVVVEVATSEMIVSREPLSRMPKLECACKGGCRSIHPARHTPSNDNGIRESQWYFDRADFDTRYEIDKRTIVALRDARTGHARARHGLRTRDSISLQSKLPERQFPTPYPTPSCSSCGQIRKIMIAMEPRDEAAWSLCSSCWSSDMRAEGSR